MKIKKMTVKGMNEQQDVRNIKEALYDVWGVTQVEVSLNGAEVRLTYDENAASEVDIERAVIDQGFDIGKGDTNA